MKTGFQLALKLNVSSNDVPQWREGTPIKFLGRDFTLSLTMSHPEATLEGDQLHLPLPPHATQQQIRDRAEAWLRDQAQRILRERIRELHKPMASASGYAAPDLKLAFAARSPWAEVEDNHTLRCNWRLIEKNILVIDQVLAHALASLPGQEAERDLFGFAFSARSPEVV